MKKTRKIIAVLLCVVLLACSFAACSSSGSDSDVTSSKTDSSVQSDDKNNKTDDDKDKSEKSDNSGKSDKKDTSDKSDKSNKSDNKDDSSKSSKDTIKKPDKPANVTSLKASSVTSSSVTLTWKKVKCTAYRVRVFDTKGNKLKDVTCKGNSYKVTKLESYTSYEFRVRAYNENDAGKSESKDSSITATTKSANTQRKIKISVLLPKNSAKSDTLNIYITNGKKTEKVKSAKVKCDGSTYTFTTSKKYQGVVTIKAELVDSKTSDSVKTDKKSVTLNLTKIGIVQIDGEDD